MQLTHWPADSDEPTVLASEVEVADTLVSQARGLMFRRSIPSDYALAFRFGRPRTRGVHMVFVPFPIDVIWASDGVVGRVSQLRPWVGIGRHEADLLVELSAGAASDVTPGDRIDLCE